MKGARSVKKRRDFREICANGRVGRSGALVVYAKSREGGTGPSRVGLSVAWRGSSAVERNRIKRRLRAAAKEQLPQAGWDVVVRGSRGASDKSFQELSSELAAALRTVGVLR